MILTGFRVDTAHLSVAEAGGYARLAAFCMERGGLLPKDDRSLRQITGMTNWQWSHSKPAIMALFCETETGLTHPKTSQFLEIQQLKKLSRCRGAKATNTIRWQKVTDRSAIASCARADAPADITPRVCADDDDKEVRKKEVSKKEHTATLRVSVPTKRASRLPADWCANESEWDYAADLGLNAGEVETDFREFWLAKSGPNATKLDWGLTWRRWCREAASRLRDRASGRSGGKFRGNGAAQLLVNIEAEAARRASNVRPLYPDRQQQTLLPAPKKPTTIDDMLNPDFWRNQK